MTESKRCPFCGSDDVRAETLDEGGIYLYCCNCKIEQPLYPNINKAIEAWNRRADNEID